METAILAGGCFWCTEAIFRRLNGVLTVVPGYTGGTVEHPTYEQVCTGSTGHAEAIQITFDPVIISYQKLLEIFFHLHDSTTLNHQGSDVGTQYRSAIFYRSEEQKKIALVEKEKISGSVTEIIAAGEFYPAEEYHHDYYQKNSYQPYCQYIIDPKLQKLLAQYRNDVQENYREG